MLTVYRRKKKITIDSSLVDADLTDFPMLVSISGDADIGTNAESNGDDIRFTTDDGKTEINYEIEDFTITTGTATGNFWVKVPNVSASSDTVIYMYYGHETASTGANTNAVWDANHQMVLHMNDATTSSITDSTSNGRDGTKLAANEPIEATAKIGQGQDFDGTDDYVDMPKNFSIFDGTGPFSFSLWFRMDTSDQSKNFLIDFLGERNVFLQIYTNDSIRFRRRINGSWTDIITNQTFSVETWYFVTVVYDNVNGSNVYIDGVSDVTDSTTGTIDARTDENRIGGFSGSSTQHFDGIIDEVRVSNVTRSPAWVKASYHSENSSLASIGPEIKKRFTKTFNGVAARKIKTINGIDVW